jgi:Kef-type K+ transport system membrane component KefB
MLARIIKEKGLTGTPAGVLALTAGATDDAAAWCILAIVLSSFQGNSTLAWLAIGGGAAYAIVALGAMLPLLSAWESKISLRLRSKGSLLGAAMILLCLGASFTDYVGIYAVFGAFVLGVAMPRKYVAPSLRRDIEPLVTVVFLPLFFVYSGLNTRISLLFTPTVLLYSVIIIVLASLGKGLACALAARYAGQPPRESLMIGALMNARGLMELILLNIGLERGVITPTLFAMMVMMAVVTTFMASPIFSALHVKYSHDDENSGNTHPAQAAHSP